MKDIADLAGVTKQTVSNVINRPEVVDPRTRQRIETLIGELGYRPNLLARGLATGRTMMVGLIVPNLSNPFYAGLVEAIVRRLGEDAYHLVLCTTGGDPAQVEHQLGILDRRSVDGLLVADHAVLDRLETLERLALPTVFCSWEFAVPEGEVGVTYDFAASGRLAAQHLLELGHSQIAVIASLPEHQRRLAGVYEALEAAGEPLPPHRLRVTEGTTVADARDVAEVMLREQPEITGVIALHDLGAVGVLDAARAAGRPVPASLSLVSIDDSRAAWDARPALTSVALPKIKLAGVAVTQLLAHVRDRSLRSDRVTLIEPHLVTRSSAARPALR